MTGDVARGLLVHGSEDVSLGLIRQLWLWHARGLFTDRTGRLSYSDALGGIRTPVQVLACQGDPHCPPDRASPVLTHLEGPSEFIDLDQSWSHLDPLLSPRARETVFPRVVAWLDRHRRRAWED